MSDTWLTGFAFCCAAVPAVLWVWNMLLLASLEPAAVRKWDTAFCRMPSRC